MEEVLDQYVMTGEDMIRIALENSYNDRIFWNFLSQEPPEEWVSIGISEVTKEEYKYISIETLEMLMDSLFLGWSDKITFQDISLFEKSAVATTTVQVFYSLNGIRRTKSGTSSITVVDNFLFNKEGKMVFLNAKYKKPVRAAELLRQATPLSLTEAKKNAIKNICNLFGRNLNRVEELEVYSETPHEKVKADAIVLKKYQNAKRDGDEEAILKIESRYTLTEMDNHA